MKGELRSVSIEISGRIYHIKTKDDDSYIQNLARIVNEQMSEIIRATNTVDSLRVADMTALNLADEYLKLKQTYETHVLNFEQERMRLRSLVEAALGPNDSLPDA